MEVRECEVRSLYEFGSYYAVYISSVLLSACHSAGSRVNEMGRQAGRQAALE